MTLSTKKGFEFSFFLELLLTAFVIIVVALITYNLFSHNTDIKARVFFDDLIESYEACLHTDTTECYCEPFDSSKLPKNTQVVIVDLEQDHLRFSLMKDGDIILTRDVPGKQLCLYSRLSQEEYNITSAPMLLPRIGNFFTFYKTSQGLCVIGSTVANPLSFEPVSLNTITQEKISCTSPTTSSPFMGFINLEAREPTGLRSEDPSWTNSFRDPFLSYSNPFLSYSNPITLLGTSWYQRRQLFTASQSLAELEHLDNTYLLSVILDEANNPQDTIEIAYLASSQRSQAFASIVKDYLEQVNHKYYDDLQDLTGKTTDPSYLLDFTVVLRPIQDSDEAFFLKENNPLYPRKDELSALFIYYLDNSKDQPLLDHHVPILGHSLALATKHFLRVPSSETSKEKDNLFEPPA